MSASNKTCPTAAQIECAFTDEDLDRFADHLDICAECAAVRDQLERTAHLARSVPVAPMSSRRRGDLKQEIIARAKSRKSNVSQSVGSTDAQDTQALSSQAGRWRAGAAALAAAALAIGLWAHGPGEPELAHRPAPAKLDSPSERQSSKETRDAPSHPEPASPVYRATIHGPDGARFARIGGQPDEIVRLYDGTITVEVDPLHHGERFRVITGDAEVEVHGTVFDVRAEQDRLQSVRVVRGQVAVRPADSSQQMLDRGQRWKRRPDGPRQAPGPEAPKHAETAAPKPKAIGESAGKAFEQGWRALQRDEPVEAAKRLAQVPPGAAVSEDAAYWRGIALFRGHRRAQAIRVLENFLDTYPQSARAGRARVNLGWISRDLKRDEAARRWFEAALNDDEAVVRKSARRGLEHLDGAGGGD